MQSSWSMGHNGLGLRHMLRLTQGEPSPLRVVGTQDQPRFRRSAGWRRSLPLEIEESANGGSQHGANRCVGSAPSE